MGNQYSYKAVQQTLISYSVQHRTYASVGKVFPLMEASAAREEISAAPGPSLYDWDLSDPRELLARYDHFHLGPKVISTDVAYRISPDVYRVRCGRTSSPSCTSPTTGLSFARRT